MGKPSSTKLSVSCDCNLKSSLPQHLIYQNYTQRSSTASIRSKKSKRNSKMNLVKNRKKLKKRNRQAKSIQKLFDNLRNQSQELNNDLENDNSVICLDDSSFRNSTTDCTLNETVVFVNDVAHSSNNRKRKLSKDSVESPKHKKNVHTIQTAEKSQTNIECCTSNVRTPNKKSNLVFCSTPILNNNKNISKINISSLSNDNNINNNLDITAQFSKKVEELTKEINEDSFLTIDLTTESLDQTKNAHNTVIDLEKDNNDCTIVSDSYDSLSMSGDSNVTVLRKSDLQKKNDRKLQRVAKDIGSLLNANQKKKLFTIITQTLLNGCDVSLSGTSLKEKKNNATETDEDTFIKEVILGETPRRNSVGSNIYNPAKEIKTKSGLRMIVIDGSNVAMGHGQHNTFSVKGLKICIDYFVRRGHIVKAFVPRFRCKFGKSTEPRVLDDLERQGLVVYTPSREVQGRFIVPYDDRYIVQCATEFDGVIVSGDNYRDLALENPRWKFIIENRLLQFTWVNDMIMFPKDPLGRYGPTLEQFLRHSN